MDQSQNKMGTQKIVPLIFSMALPAMISMLISALYNIVDSIFVAKYSQDALTAVSLVFPLQQLVIAIAVGTGVGVNSLIARRLGARMQSEADNAAKHGVALSVVSGIVFVFIGFFLSRPFLAAFTNRASVPGAGGAVFAHRSRPVYLRHDFHYVRKNSTGNRQYDYPHGAGSDRRDL